MCALLFNGQARRPELRTLCDAAVPAVRPYLFRYANRIYGLELLALVLFFEDWAPFLQGKCCWVYVDNNNCLAAIVRGDSNTDAIAVLVARLWQLIQRFNICVWFPRVAPKLNPADLPARNRIPPFKAHTETSFRSMRPLYALCRKKLSQIPERNRNTRRPLFVNKKRK